MPSKHPTAGTKLQPHPTAGTKLGPGEPLLNVLRAPEVNDQASADCDFPAELPAELPADLAPLASQLQSDAAGLASIYPPSARPPLPKARPAATRIALERAGGAAAALLIGAIGVWSIVPRPADSPPAAAVSNRRPLAKTTQPGASPPALSTAAANRPTFSVAELTGPELEALVDLMQRDPAAVQRVAF